MADKTWDANCREVAQHLQRNCKTLEDAWSLVGDLGEKALAQYGDTVMTTTDMSKAIGELYENAAEELDPGEVRAVRSTNAWREYEQYFTREADIRKHIGQLTVEGQRDNNNVRIKR